LDSLPLFEFLAIFVRLSSIIDLRGLFSEAQIENELNKAQERSLKMANKANTYQQRAKWKRIAVSYRQLMENGFARRAIREAKRDPNGRIGMTLRFGHQEAKKRMLAQKRANIRGAIRLRRMPRLSKVNIDAIRISNRNIPNRSLK
jgi:hypothetical protein